MMNRLFDKLPWKGKSFFWASKDVGKFYLLLPFLLVLLTTEALLTLHGLNVTILSFLLAASALVSGSALLRSARKLDIAHAEQHSAYYLRVWMKVKIIKVGSFMAALTVISAYYLAPGNKIIPEGNPILTILVAMGILYVVDLYLVIWPLSYWSPSQADFSRLHLASLLEQRGNDVETLRRALHSLSKGYTKARGLRLLPRAYIDVGKLNHKDIRNLGLRLQYAMQRSDYETAVQAVVAATGNVRDAIVTGKRTPREVVEDAVPFIKVLIAILTMVILLLVIFGKLPAIISP